MTATIEDQECARCGDFTLCLSSDGLCDGCVAEDYTPSDTVQGVGDRLTTAQVAELLGVSPATIAAYSSRGVMPASSACECCGYAPTWQRTDIVAWMTARPGQGKGGGRPRKTPG